MNQPPTLLSYLNLNGAPRAGLHGPAPAGLYGAAPAGSVPLIGVFRGCGVGPSVVDGALEVLQAIGQVLGIKFDIEYGGVIGEDSVERGGLPLPEEAVEFCDGVFRRGGAILNGPGGGRYVYELRRRFDLFCKFVPVRPLPELAGVGAILARHVEDVDLLLVRDNVGGVYQGIWSEHLAETGRVAAHSFEYRETDVRRIAETAVRAAAGRRGGLQVMVKDGGVPSVSALWRDVCGAAARAGGVRAEFMNVDFAAYELIQHPARFDVIVTPNLFGDILADVAGALVSSRGVTFSGNFDPQGHGIYQTNHGCAHDLCGADAANPGGQILSLAMLLRESFALTAAAALIESSLADVWAQGWRTVDVAEPGCCILGTRDFVARVVEQVLRSPQGEKSYARSVTLG
jgi:3-isopropylmalate dehydrogenase